MYVCVRVGEGGRGRERDWDWVTHSCHIPDNSRKTIVAYPEIQNKVLMILVIQHGFQTLSKIITNPKFYYTPSYTTVCC